MSEINQFQVGGVNYPINVTIQGATENNFPKIDAEGNLLDSGISASDVSDAIDALDDKADLVTGAEAGNLAALDSTGNLTDSGVSSADLVLSTSQTLTEAQQTQARHNISAPKWAAATATNKPAAGGTSPVQVLSVDDAEGGEPISLTFAADNASGVANDGKYELYGYLRIYHQLAKVPALWTRTSSSGSTVTINDNVITVEVSANYQGARTTGMTSLSSAQSGHYFLYSCEAKAEDENSVGKSVYPTVSQNAGVSYSGFALTNDWVSHSQIKAAGTISPDQFIFTALSGTKFQLRNVMLFDLTQMFPVDRPTTVSAFWSKMAAAGYGTGYQAPTADTNLVQSTFDFSTDPIAAEETEDVTAETSLQTGYNQIVQTDGSTTDNTVTLTYPRDIGIVLDNLAAAIAALPSSGN